MLRSKATGNINEDKQRELMVELGIEAGKRSALDYHKTAAERLEALSEEDRQKDDLLKFYDVNV